MKKTFKNIAMMATALLALSACSSTKKVSDNKSNDMTSMTTEEDDIDPEFMVLSDAQYDLVKRNNQFALNLFSEVKGLGSSVISPMSVTYLMAMLANGAEASTR